MTKAKKGILKQIACFDTKTTRLQILLLIPVHSGIYNLRQYNVDKFTKLSKTCFSKECFTADFSRFFSRNLNICIFGSQLDTYHTIQAF